MSNQPTITDNNFPGLFLASDAASKRAQKSYITVVAIDLILMVIASALAVYNYQTHSSKTILYSVTGFFLLISLVLTIVLLTMKFEDTWYQGRALAESCKTLTWRFITCSELFEHNLPLDDVKRKFVKRIDELGKEFSELNKSLKTDLSNKPIITSFMLTIRSLSLEERKDYYINNRIENQKTWYSKKSKFNKTMYNTWFGIIITMQTLSIVCSVILIANADSNWNFVGFFTTVSASAISWLQLKRHQELKQAYTTTAQELNSIVALSSDIGSEDEFSKFVLDSENAV